MSDEEEEAGGDDGGTPAWMATFADMMSLLLTFFVLILSFANMDVIKFSAAVDSLHDAFGTAVALDKQPGSPSIETISFDSSPRSRIIQLEAGGSKSMDKLRQQIEAMIKRARMDNLVEVEESDRGIIIRVVGHLLFDPGSAELRPESYLLLNELAQLIRAVGDPVSIEGHTDDTPAGTTRATNWRLSTERAISVLSYLSEVQEVDESRLSVAGYGATRPVKPNDSEEHREANRRVEFVFSRATESS